jgi:hypothetical protein
MAAHASVDSLASYITTTLEIRDRWWEKDEEDERRSRKDSETRRDDGRSPPSDFWFRGHASARWALTPKLYRADSRLKLGDEDEIRNDFKRRGRQLISEPFLPANDKEWYFLMQHYGAPTRLLDWTDGSLLGLYFALRSQKPDRPADAAVWMLDPNWLNEVTLKGEEQNYLGGVLLPEWKETDAWFPVTFEEPLLVDEPIAIDPPHVARRVAVQHSHFTIHGRTPRGLERLARGGDARLVKIVIPRRVVQRILEDLAACGVTETTVYPDLEALSREVSRKWQRRPSSQ